MIFNTYVLSLTDEIKRRHNISQQLSQLNIPFSFVDAVDLRNKDMQTIQPLYSEGMARKNINRELTRGEIGCALSHINIYKKIIDSDKEWALIIEDDAILERMDSNYLSSIIQNTSGYDTIILGYSKVLATEEKQYYWRFPVKKKFSLEKGILGIPSSQWACGAVAYLINKKGAEKIIEEYRQNSNKITTFADDWGYFEKTVKLDILHHRPLLVFEDFMRLTSSLEQERTVVSNSRPETIFVRWVRNIKGLIRKILLYIK